ncbi:MAG: transcriptional regulator [Pseudonocardiales bacterium]|nr:MAG: transcriptional regulator [Pseudonocardiales bacterium]
MAQVTWRAPDELVARVRRAADQRGSSINEFLTRVLDAATDPELTDDESLRVRERLAAAGLLAQMGPPHPRPAEDDVAGARRRAGQGHQLAELIHDSRE